MPDGDTLNATKQGSINISPHLSSIAQNATVLQNLNSSSLISLGQICDDKCTIVMNSSKLYATKTKNISIKVDENNKIMHGNRNCIDGLYDIEVHPKIKENYILPKLNSIISQQAMQQPTYLTSKKKIHFTPKSKKSVQNMTIKKFNNIILPIIEDNAKSLLPVPLIKTSKLNVIIRKNKTKKDLVKFLHAAAWSPVTDTWIKAIKNNHFTTWPGLSPELVRKHLPPSVATAEGHMKQERQGLQSTKTKTLKLKNNKAIREKAIMNHSKKNTQVKCTDLSRSDYFKEDNKVNLKNNTVKIFDNQATLPSLTSQEVVAMDSSLDNNLFPVSDSTNIKKHKTYKEEAELDAFPPSPVPNIKTKEVLYYFCDTQDLNVAYSDLTGRFPVQSSQGNNYHIIAYHPDANGILVQAIKNRQAQTIVDGWEILNNRFLKAGLQPTTWIMDDECSADLKAALF